MLTPAAAGEFPQGLKPNSTRPRNGTAEAVPLQTGIGRIWPGCSHYRLSHISLLTTHEDAVSSGLSRRKLPYTDESIWINAVSRDCCAARF
jgi:hypothetical protein